MSLRASLLKRITKIFYRKTTKNICFSDFFRLSLQYPNENPTFDMKIETLLHRLALVLAAFALGLHVASRLLFPEAGMTGSLPVWLLLLCTGVLCGSGRKRTDLNESENPQPLK